MKKSITSVLACAAILASGVAYAVEDETPLYPELPVISTIPEEGTELPGLFEGDAISITIAEEMLKDYPNIYMTYELEENSNGTWENYKSMSWLNRLIDIDTEEPTNTFAADVYGNFEMEVGTQYRLVFTGYESEMYQADVLGQTFVYLKGTTPAFNYSPVTFESISPEDAGTEYDNVYNEKAILTPDLPYFTVTFTGDVTLENTGSLLGSGAGIQQFKCEPASDALTVGDKEYASEWHIIIPDGFVASQSNPVIISMKAYDEEGRIVKGNVGEKSSSYFLFNYNVPGMYGEGEVSFGTEPLGIVSAVTVKSPIGVNVSWMVPFDEAKVMSNGVEVAHVVDSQLIFDPEDADKEDAVAKQVRLMLDQPVSKAGEYTFVLPSGFLNYGTQFIVLYQLAMEVPFTVVESPYVEAYPEPGVVESLHDFYLQYEVDDEIAINPEATERPYLYSAELQKELGAWDSVDAMGNTLSLTYRTTITDPDNYSLIIPNGFLMSDGKPLPGVSFEYAIEGGAAVEANVIFTPAPGELSQLPERIDFVFPDNEVWATGGGVATIQFNNEEPQKLPDALFDWDAPENEGYQPLGEFANRAIDGTCTITFPAGYLTADDENLPEIKVVYTNGGGGGDDPVIIENPSVKYTPAAGEVTALPDEVIFRFDDYEYLVNYESAPATIKFNDEAPVDLPFADINQANPDDWQEGVISLGEFAGKTDKGTYTITFPQGYFYLNTADTYDMLNSEMVLVYTISGGNVEPEPIKFEPADNTELKALPAYITLTFPAEWIEGESDQDPTIKYNDNEPVALPEFEKDYDLPALLYRQSLGDFAGATAEGTYVISFPKNFFRMGSWAHVADAVPVEAMTVTYTVKNGSGVTLVGIEADRYFVYDLNGVKVLETTDAADLKALKGLYIVNGVKIVLD